MTKFCNKCGTKTASNSKLCKDCAYIQKLQNDRKGRVAKRQKEEGTFGTTPIRTKLGTIDVMAEHKAIRKEMKRLGLRQ